MTSAPKQRGMCLDHPKGSLGKSRLDGHEVEITALLAKRVSKASLARILDVSDTTLAWFVRSRRL